MMTIPIELESQERSEWNIKFGFQSQQEWTGKKVWKTVKSLLTRLFSVGVYEITEQKEFEMYSSLIFIYLITEIPFSLGQTC